MTRFVRRLRALVILAGFCAACSAVSTIQPGTVVDRPHLQDAQSLIWKTTYARTDAPPVAYLVEGADLTCKDPGTDLPGFNCPTVGCREGCTSNPLAVTVAYRAVPWSQTALAHEDMHVWKIRAAIDLLQYSPTAAVMSLLADHDHKGPEWEPGGAVDKANALLVANGL